MFVCKRAGEGESALMCEFFHGYCVIVGKDGPSSTSSTRKHVVVRETVSVVPVTFLQWNPFSRPGGAAGLGEKAARHVSEAVVSAGFRLD